MSVSFHSSKSSIVWRKSSRQRKSIAYFWWRFHVCEFGYWLLLTYIFMWDHRNLISRIFFWNSCTVQFNYPIYWLICVFVSMISIYDTVKSYSPSFPSIPFFPSDPEIDSQKKRVGLPLGCSHTRWFFCRLCRGNMQKVVSN